MMRKDLPFLIIIFIAVIILYSGLIFKSTVVLEDGWDWTSQHRFWKAFSHQSFYNTGELPLWNPYIFCGTPYLGHPSASTYFYPLNILFIRFDTDNMLVLYLIIHSLIAGMSMFYFIKGFDLGRYISLYSAVAFMYGGAMMAKISYGQLSNMVVISYVPLLFLLIRKIWITPKWIPAMLLGIVWGFQFAAGNVHMFYVSALVIGFYLLYKTMEKIIIERKLKPVLKRILFIICAVLICIGFSSGQLLPSMETAAWSTRTQSTYEYCTTLSLPVWHTATFIFPDLLGTPVDGSYIGSTNYTELYGYMGIVPFIFVIIGLISRSRREIYPWLALIGLTLLLSLGKYTPVYWIAYKVIPGLNLFRIPATFLFMFVFALIVASSFGLKRIVEVYKDIKTYKYIKWLLTAIGIILILIILFKPFDYAVKKIKPETYSNQVSQNINIAVLHTAIIFILFLAVFLIRPDKKLMLSSLIFIVFADLLIVAIPLLKTKPVENIFPEAPWLEKINADIEDEHYRLYDIKTVSQHLTHHYGIQKITGTDPIILKHYLRFTNLLGDIETERTVEQLPIMDITEDQIKNPVVLDLLNVKYLLTKKPLRSRRYEKISDYTEDNGSKVMLYRNRNYLPRAWLVDKVKYYKDYEFVLEKITDFDPRDVVLLEESAREKINKSNSLTDKDLKSKSSRGEVSINFYTPNRIIMTVDSPGDAILIVSDTWMTGWKAKVNGERAPVVRANYILRGIPVKSGTSRVELFYLPDTLISGALITFTVLGIVLIFIIIGFVKYIIDRMRPATKRLVSKRRSYK